MTVLQAVTDSATDDVCGSASSFVCAELSPILYTHHMYRLMDKQHSYTQLCVPWCDVACAVSPRARLSDEVMGTGKMPNNSP